MKPKRSEGPRHRERFHAQHAHFPPRETVELPRYIQEPVSNSAHVSAVKGTGS